MKVIRKIYSTSRGLIFEIKLNKDETVSERDIIEVDGFLYTIKELDFWRDLSKGFQEYRTFAIVKSEDSN